MKRYRIAFWVSLGHAVVVLALAVLVNATFTPGVPVDYAKTPFFVGFVNWSLSHLPQYLWMCFGLSCVAALHFRLKARGQRALKSALVYLTAKGSLMLAVLFFTATVWALMQSRNLEDLTVYYRSGESAVLEIESVGTTVWLVGEALLSLPLWIMLALRSWHAVRTESGEGSEAVGRRGRGGRQIRGFGWWVLGVVVCLAALAAGFAWRSLRAHEPPPDARAKEASIEDILASGDVKALKALLEARPEVLLAQLVPLDPPPRVVHSLRPHDHVGPVRLAVYRYAAELVVLDTHRPSPAHQPRSPLMESQRPWKCLTASMSRSVGVQTCLPAPTWASTYLPKASWPMAVVPVAIWPSPK